MFALTAATQVELMLAQCQTFSPRYAVMASAEHAQQLAARVKALGLAVEVLAGEQALCDVSADPSRGCRDGRHRRRGRSGPSLAAARAGKKLLLANKEALVVGGDLFMQAVKDGGATTAAHRQRALGGVPVLARRSHDLGRDVSRRSC